MYIKIILTHEEHVLSKPPALSHDQNLAPFSDFELHIEPAGEVTVDEGTTLIARYRVNYPYNSCVFTTPQGNKLEAVKCKPEVSVQSPLFYYNNKKNPRLRLNILHRKKKDSEFPVPSRDVTTKLSLGGNNDVITELFLPRGSLVSDIPAGDGKLVNLFLRCSLSV